MKQAVLVGPRRFDVVQGPIPELGTHDVLIKVSYCGVCMGEVGTWSRSLEGSYPLYIGHEISGVITAKGAAVEQYGVGQRVMAITMGRGYADFVRADQNELVEVPATLPLRDALGEPLACAVNAAGRANIALGDTVVIVGAGFMGLLMLQLVLLRGASRVFMVDLREEMGSVARSLGASAMLSPSDALEQIGLATKGVMADVVIEATGKEAALQLAGDLVRTRGTVVIYGYHQEGMRSVNIGQWNWKGIDVINGHERETARYVEGMRRAMALAAEGRVQLRPLVTHVFPGDEINQAFALAEQKPANFIKAVTQWAESVDGQGASPAYGI